MRKALFPIVALVLLIGAMSARLSFAGIWEQPTAEIDEFNSLGWKTLVLLPAWTGLPDPQRVEFHGIGPTAVVRDSLNAAFVQDGLDTINTEIVDFHLVGQVSGFHTELQAGFSNTFFSDDSTAVSLDHTRGQIQDLAGLPDGSIDFPADSIFDVFFDIWIDLNGDGVPDLGEVLSNDIRDASGDADPLSFALRMQQMNLEAVPPPPGTIYQSWDIISALDPEIGTFQATSLPLPLDLYPIQPDRQAIGPAHAQLVNAIHEVVPEPSSHALLAPGLALLWLRRRRQKAAS